MKRPLAIIAFIVAVVMVIGLVALTWDFTGSSQDAQDVPGDLLEVRVWAVYWHEAGPEHNESGQFVLEVSFDVNNDGTYEQVNTSEPFNNSHGAFAFPYAANLTLPDNVSKTIKFKVQIFNVTNDNRIQMDFGSDGIITANTTKYSIENHSLYSKYPVDPSLNTCAINVMYVVDPVD